MELDTTYVDVPIVGRTMRTYVAAPADDKQYPGIIFYSDIFQLSPSTLRWVTRLASYGFVVAAPEIYFRIEEPGTVLEFDDEGQEAWSGRCRRAVRRAVRRGHPREPRVVAHVPRVSAAPLGIAGHCTGGHIAFRAALQPEVAATACWYATACITESSEPMPTLDPRSAAARSQVNF